MPGEPPPHWLRWVHADRDGRTLLGDSVEDDVADPIGGLARHMQPPRQNSMASSAV